MSDLLAASRRRTLARLRFGVAAAFLLPLLALVAAGAFLYRQAFQEAGQNLDASLRIAQEHALKMLETNEMLLERMLDLLGTDTDAQLLARSAELHERLKGMARELPQVQGLFMHAADSRSLGTNRVFPPPRHIDYSDREWYKAHRGGGGPPLFITEHLKSRATGEAIFDMSRRRVLPDGSFAGSVHVSLRPEYLTAFWQEVAANVHGLRLVLLRADGRLIARHPGGVPDGAALAPEHPLMRRIAAGLEGGAFDSVSPFDGVSRLAAFRKLGDYPVYVTAGVGRAEVIAGWAARVALLALFVVPLACALAWMAWVALKRTREELDAVQRLEEETVRRQRTELALAHSQKLETVGQLAGGVAHDFNNLLMIVTSNLHLLARRLPHDAQRPLAAIERAIAAGSRQTRQLLALAGRQALAPEHVRLQERLPALLALVGPALPGSIELATEVAPDTAAIFVDPAELELALINLALNAKDAIEGGGGIAVSARNAPPGDVVIEVADTGRGIDPAIAGRVLEPFFTTKAPGKGTGLGLTQVQALCRAAGGRMEIDSRPGGGTRVRLFFPRSAAGERDEPLGCSVLLAEDEDAVANATSAVLESIGCRVRRVASARAALEAVADGTFDLLLSDIRMPGDIDGVELAARVRAERAQLPVVLMTGDGARLAHAAALGFDVLAKPCSATVLRDAISTALAGGSKAGPKAAAAL